MQFTDRNGPENGLTICGCCGSKFNRWPVSPDNYLGLIGINVYPSNTPDTTETDGYWTESVPIGDEFLVIRHRKQHPDDLFGDEDEE